MRTIKEDANPLPLPTTQRNDRRKTMADDPLKLVRLCLSFAVLFGLLAFSWHQWRKTGRGGWAFVCGCTTGVTVLLLLLTFEKLTE